METISHYFRYFYDVTGLNFSVLYDPYDRMRWLVGIKTTLLLAAWSVGLSLLIGLTGAILLRTRQWYIVAIIRGYVHIFRNTPPLAQLYFFYFAIGPLLPYRLTEDGLRQPYFDNFAWAVISLSLLQGALSLEIFRSGFDAIPRSLTEAADALAIGRFVQLFKIQIPLALRICLPALQGNIINSIKTTSLAYAIAVPEMLYAANQIWGDRVNVTEMMIVMLVSYVALVGIAAALMSRVERRLKLPGYGDK